MGLWDRIKEKYNERYPKYPGGASEPYRTPEEQPPGETFGEKLRRSPKRALHSVLTKGGPTLVKLGMAACTLFLAVRLLHKAAPDRYETMTGLEIKFGPQVKKADGKSQMSKQGDKIVEADSALVALHFRNDEDGDSHIKYGLAIKETTQEILKRGDKLDRDTSVSYIGMAHTTAADDLEHLQLSYTDGAAIHPYEWAQSGSVEKALDATSEDSRWDTYRVVGRKGASWSAQADNSIKGNLLDEFMQTKQGIAYKIISEKEYKTHLERWNTLKRN